MRLILKNIKLIYNSLIGFDKNDELSFLSKKIDLNKMKNFNTSKVKIGFSSEYLNNSIFSNAVKDLNAIGIKTKSFEPNKIILPYFRKILTSDMKRDLPKYILEHANKDLVIKDHKSIIIDELVGTWISLLPVLFIADDRYERIIYAAIALILFRFFDILKPYPISFFDKEYKNGLGIVLDDVIAGIFSGILSVILLILLI